MARGTVPRRRVPPREPVPARDPSQRQPAAFGDHLSWRGAGARDRTPRGYAPGARRRRPPNSTPTARTSTTGHILEITEARAGSASGAAEGAGTRAGGGTTGLLPGAR